MSNYNFEGQPEGDWDDRGDLSWQEYDWQQYLVRHEQELDKFIELYNSLKDQPDHIDEVAHKMGWDAEDWSVGDGSDEDEDSAEDSDEEDIDDAQEDFDPYTLLRHPVFVVVRGLYRYLRSMWAHYQLRDDVVVNPSATWALAQTLSEGEMHATLSLQSLDMGDYALAVCQIKLALDSVNKTFTVLPAVLPGCTPAEQLVEQEFRVRLFDLREVCLRVLNDCREQIRRNGRNG
ncbi:MAG: hypothetical protein WC360_03720 [Opitutales bacterium]|jgi:hypothetical protein